MKAIERIIAERGRWARVVGVLAGLLLTQLILYGPSLTGSKLHLPLDLLALPWTYLPDVAEYESVVPKNLDRSDLIYSMEHERQFVASEFRAGRLPLWTPSQFAGAPFADFPKYSPFTLLYCLFPSPVTLGWIQLSVSLVAGIGTYVFCRRILELGFWPAATAATCYPMTGFFVILQGFPNTYPVAWLPWALLVTDQAIRRPWSKTAILLTPLTGVILISGQVDAAGHVLLATGIYAIWCLFDMYGRPLRPVKLASAAVSIGLAWALGIMLAAPYFLPLGEYVLSGLRVDEGNPSVIDRPPIGLSELPRMVLPRFYGTREYGWCHIGKSTSWTESSAVTYTGLLATLVASALAWCSTRHRSINIFLLILIVISTSWILDLPGLVMLFRLPFLDLRAHNRFVFVASFALLSLAAVGLEVLWQKRFERRRWFWLAAAVPLVLGVWCAYRTYRLPEPVATQIESRIRAGNPTEHASDLPTAAQIRHSFRLMYGWSAALCGVATIAWLLLLAAKNTPSWFGPVLAALCVAELLWFAHSTDLQSDPELYFPKIPALAAIAESSNDRILGVDCLPPKLFETHGLRDVRGYDAIDPAPIIQLLNTVRVPRDEENSPHYAKTLYYVPRLGIDDDGRIVVPGVLNMLNVRYLVFQGEQLPLAQPVKPWLHIQDYWVLENQDVLPRAFVPQRVETISSHSEVLARLASDDFDPRRLAYVDQSVSLPDECRGSAKIVEERPSRITIEVDMQTPGLVVLADQWMRGWQAEVDGRPARILRTNHALRGVQLPSGRSTLTFQYSPASFTWGVRLMIIAVAALALWIVLRCLHIRLTESVNN